MHPFELDEDEQTLNIHPVKVTQVDEHGDAVEDRPEAAEFGNFIAFNDLPSTDNSARQLVKQDPKRKEAVVIVQPQDSATGLNGYIVIGSQKLINSGTNPLSLPRVYVGKQFTYKAQSELWFAPFPEATKTLHVTVLDQRYGE